MPTTETRRLNPVLLWVIFLAVLALAILAAYYFNSNQVEIKAASVTRQPLSRTVSTTGRVEPIDYFPAYAPAPGVVTKIYVDVLQKVKAGDLLIKVDDSDAVAHLASANATLQTAEANLHDLTQGGTQDERNSLSGDLNRAQLQQQQATNDLAALKQLQEKGAASVSEVSAAQQRLQTADSTVKSLQMRSTQRYSGSDHNRAEAQVADARAAVASAQNSYAKANIRSPISGTVYSIPVAVYDFVKEGDSLMDVADLNHVQIRAYFDEPDIGKLAAGQSVTVKWEAKEGLTWHGHIKLPPTTVITSGTRNVGECLITVDDAKGDLLPNTNVVVTVTTAHHLDVLSVPREALHTDGGDYVYRIVSNKLVHTPVQIGILDQTRVEIVSGLSEKDTVALSATTANRELSNGLAVKTIE
jgi:HlyD family secretion protein